MKKSILTLAFLLCAVAVFGQNKQDEMVTSAQADAQPQIVYVEREKSPALAGFLSFLVPGVGQFYNGDNQDGWIDLGESVVSYALMYGGYRSVLVNGTRYNETGNTMYQSKATKGAWVFIAGLAWSAANGICSIVDAVRGAKAVNRENGYAMYPIGNGVSVGARPQLTYERPEYAMQVPHSLNAGMGIRIAF